MQVNWIIENFAKESSYKELADAVKAAGHPLLELNGDYNKKILRDKLDLNYVSVSDIAIYNNSAVIFNGSIEMAKLVQKELEMGCFPVTYSTFNKYKCSSYYSYFSNYLFNDRYCLVSLRDFYKNKFFYYGVFGKEALIFIRPDSGEKEFQAQLLDLLDIDRFFENHKHLEHELVLISTPKNILWEGRVVVSRKKEIIAHSTYRFQDQVTKIPSIPSGAIELAEKLLNIDFYPDSVFCYDLCQDNDGKFYLLELTSFSSAGLYACDKAKIVDTVSKIAAEDFNRKYNKNG